MCTLCYSLLPRRVYKKKARPIFPLGVPQQYAALAKACWDNDPPSRPPFTQVLLRLSEMLTSFTTASAQAQPPPAASPGAAPAAAAPAPAGVAAAVGAAAAPAAAPSTPGAGVAAAAPVAAVR